MSLSLSFNLDEKNLNRQKDVWMNEFVIYTLTGCSLWRKIRLNTKVLNSLLRLFWIEITNFARRRRSFTLTLVDLYIFMMGVFRHNFFCVFASGSIFAPFCEVFLHIFCFRAKRNMWDWGRGEELTFFCNFK